MVASPELAPVPGYSLTQLVLYALKLGAIGFGGPVALVGYMHRDLASRAGSRRRRGAGGIRGLSTHEILTAWTR